MVKATSTAPAACAGTVTFIVTALMTCTLVAETRQNYTVEASADVKPVRISVTTLPPAGGPAGGSNENTASGGTVYWNPPRVACLLSGFVTVTDTGTATCSLAGPSGGGAVMVVGLTTGTCVAAALPNVTAAPARKVAPVVVTTAVPDPGTLARPHA